MNWHSDKLVQYVYTPLEELFRNKLLNNETEELLGYRNEMKGDVTKQFFVPDFF